MWSWWQHRFCSGFRLVVTEQNLCLIHIGTLIVKPMYATVILKLKCYFHHCDLQCFSHTVLTLDINLKKKNVTPFLNSSHFFCLIQVAMLNRLWKSIGISSVFNKHNLWTFTVLQKNCGKMFFGSKNFKQVLLIALSQTCTTFKGNVLTIPLTQLLQLRHICRMSAVNGSLEVFPRTGPNKKVNFLL